MVKMFRNLYKIGLILAVFSLYSFTAHKYYVGLTHVFYNEKIKSVEITIQVFTDDLELTLFNRHQKHLHIGTSKEDSKANDFLIDYLNQKFELKINGNVSSYKFIGKETENDVTIIYLEIEKIKNIKSIEVTNKLLFETFEEQQHILKLKSKNEHKNIVLFKEKPKALINL